MARHPPPAWSVLSVAALLAVGFDPFAITLGDEPRAAAPRTAPVTEASVDSKLALVTRMTASDGAAQGIERSADPAALEHLQHARAALVRAAEARAGGRLPEADALVTEALAQVSVALRKVRNPREAAAQARRQYEELRARVVGFHEAYVRVIAEKSRSRGGVLEEGEVEAALRQAQAMARDDRHAEAVALLTREADRLELTLTRLRDRETLVQTLEFATIEDEVRYERNRNRSYEMLVEMVLGERSLSPRTRADAVATLAGNRGAREQADGLAASGDAKGALKVLEDSTGRLVSALRAAGVPIP